MSYLIVRVIKKMGYIHRRLTLFGEKLVPKKTSMSKRKGLFHKGLVKFWFMAVAMWDS